MFNKRFMEELFKPQELYSKKAMRTVFDRLAHASIMRLNSASMDKVGSLQLDFFCFVLQGLISLYICEARPDLSVIFPCELNVIYYMVSCSCMI